MHKKSTLRTEHWAWTVHPWFQPFISSSPLCYQCLCMYCSMSPKRKRKRILDKIVQLIVARCWSVREIFLNQNSVKVNGWRKEKRNIDRKIPQVLCSALLLLNYLGTVPGPAALVSTPSFSQQSYMLSLRWTALSTDAGQAPCLHHQNTLPHPSLGSPQHSCQNFWAQIKVPLVQNWVVFTITSCYLAMLYSKIASRKDLQYDKLIFPPLSCGLFLCCVSVSNLLLEYRFLFTSWSCSRFQTIFPRQTPPGLRWVRNAIQLPMP